jgi:CheY-like chemotaxis protein
MARILVVDDEEPVRSSIAVVLRQSGHVVILAEDGDEALAKFGLDAFDLVITDIVMPRREGIETMRALRQIDPMIRIVAMSGSGTDDGFYLKAAVALGADATVEKPLTRAALRDVVADALATPQVETAALWYRRMPDWASPLSARGDPSDPPRMRSGLRGRNS